MTRTTKDRNSGRSRKAQVQQIITAAAIGLVLVAPNGAQAQQALGVPFAGKNHLSFSVTELSRDGFGLDRKAVFGGIYGRKLNADQAPVQYSVIVRAAARAMDETDQAIADAGVTFAATHRLRAHDRLSITGAAGAGAVVWSQDAAAIEAPERVRVVARLPLTAGLAYDINVGGATLAPFVAFNGGYSDERNYVDNDRTARYEGWRLTSSTGVSLRIRETVLTLSEVNRERGMPHRNRVMFSAGMSW